MDNNSIDQQQNSLKRILHLFCILTFIGSGLYALSFLSYSLMLPFMQAQYEAGQIPIPEEFTVTLESFLNTPRQYFVICTLLYITSVVGAAMMWNIRRAGFHLYTVAQLLVLVITALFLGRSRVMLGDIMLTLLFITVYFICMRRLAGSDDNLHIVDNVEDDEDYRTDE